MAAHCSCVIGGILKPEAGAEKLACVLLWIDDQAGSEEAGKAGKGLVAG
jgi:hypothetical protein